MRHFTPQSTMAKDNATMMARIELEKGLMTKTSVT